MALIYPSLKTPFAETAKTGTLVRNWSSERKKKNLIVRVTTVIFLCENYPRNQMGKKSIGPTIGKWEVTVKKLQNKKREILEQTKASLRS